MHGQIWSRCYLMQSLSLARPKNTLWWFLATVLQCSNQSTLFIQDKTIAFTSPKLTVSMPFTSMCATTITNTFEKKKQKTFATASFFLWYFFFLKWLSKQSTNGWDTYSYKSMHNLSQHTHFGDKEKDVFP